MEVVRIVTMEAMKKEIGEVVKVKASMIAKGVHERVETCKTFWSELLLTESIEIAGAQKYLDACQSQAAGDFNKKFKALEKTSTLWGRN